MGREHGHVPTDRLVPQHEFPEEAFARLRVLTRRLRALVEEGLQKAFQQPFLVELRVVPRSLTDGEALQPSATVRPTPGGHSRRLS